MATSAPPFASDRGAIAHRCRLPTQSGARIQPTLRFLAHPPLLDLAGAGHRELVHEKDVPGYLVARDPAAAVSVDLLCGELAPRLEADEYDDNLTQTRMRVPDDRGHVDGGMG